MGSNSRNSDDKIKVVMEILKETYSEKVVSNAIFPKNMRQIDNPDGYAKITGSCGDTIEIFLKVKENIVHDASFLTDGCTPLVAAANVGISLIVGKPLIRARSMTQERILEDLGGLPERDQHCALLAANTISAAALDSNRNVQEPWKRRYRKV